MKFILISTLIVGIIGVIFYFTKYNETFNQTTTSISNKNKKNGNPTNRSKCFSCDENSNMSHGQKCLSCENNNNRNITQLFGQPLHASFGAYHQR